MSRILPIGFSLLFLLPVSALAQQATPHPQPQPQPRTLHLAVSVESRPGKHVAGLQPQDFTLLDNKVASPIASVKVLTSAQEPVEVILLVDAVNARFTTVAYERNEIQKFLRANEGRLAYPTALAVFTDLNGVQIQQGFSTDGNALNDALNHYEVGLREITRSSGIYGADDRLQLSLTAIHDVAAYAAKLPGRKIVLWISPGWPLLSGPNITLSSHQQEQIFHTIVGFSNELRDANVTLYNINPIGVGESLFRADYYESFEKGIRKPGETDLGDLGLQVLAVQSGGLAFESNSDVAGLLQRSFDDAVSWYDLTVEMRPAEHPDEYHHLEVKLDKPGLKARTRDGYYAQP